MGRIREVRFPFANGLRYGVQPFHKGGKVQKGQKIVRPNVTFLPEHIQFNFNAVQTAALNLKQRVCKLGFLFFFTAMENEKVILLSFII